MYWLNEKRRLWDIPSFRVLLICFCRAAHACALLRRDTALLPHDEMRWSARSVPQGGLLGTLRWICEEIGFRGVSSTPDRA